MDNLINEIQDITEELRADNDAALAKLQQEEQQQMEENKTIHEKLSDIQKQLKTPKSEYNKFGKYKYRNCEDILAALKPYLINCTVTVTDEIKIIPDVIQTYTDKDGNTKEQNGLMYVEATAIITDGQTYIASKAQAGINLHQAGMSVAQCFGASSSYARKYALGGLFLLDDTKDADSQDNRTIRVHFSKGFDTLINFNIFFAFNVYSL